MIKSELSNIGYTAIEVFGKDSEERWKSYIEWSKLFQLKELITLDGVLCPNLIQALTYEDWKHNLSDENMLYCFRDFEYLLNRISNYQSNYHILGIVKNPTSLFPHGFNQEKFSFVGYDLIETEGEISALTNCGGFDKAFQREDLTEYGLIYDFDKVIKVRELLINNYPSERHAVCDIWAIWKMEK